MLRDAGDCGWADIYKDGECVVLFWEVGRFREQRLAFLRRAGGEPATDASYVPDHSGKLEPYALARFARSSEH